jgi:hypothetical protein
LTTARKMSKRKFTYTKKNGNARPKQAKTNKSISNSSIARLNMCESKIPKDKENIYFGIVKCDNKGIQHTVVAIMV